MEINKFDPKDFIAEDFEPARYLFCYKGKWIDGKIYREEGELIVALYDLYDDVYYRLKCVPEITHCICLGEE